MEWKKTFRTGLHQNALVGWLPLSQLAGWRREDEARLEAYSDAEERMIAEKKASPSMSVDAGVEFVLVRCPWLSRDLPIAADLYGDLTLYDSITSVFKELEESTSELADDEDEEWDGDPDEVTAELIEKIVAAIEADPNMDAETKKLRIDATRQAISVAGKQQDDEGPEGCIKATIAAAALGEMQEKAINSLIENESTIIGVIRAQISEAFPSVDDVGGKVQCEQVLVSHYHDGKQSYIEFEFSSQWETDYNYHLVFAGTRFVALVESGQGWTDDYIANKEPSINPFGG